MELDRFEAEVASIRAMPYGCGTVDGACQTAIGRILTTSTDAGVDDAGEHDAGSEDAGI